MKNGLESGIKDSRETTESVIRVRKQTFYWLHLPDKRYTHLMNFAAYSGPLKLPGSTP